MSALWANIPNELQQLKQWVIWKAVDRDGKLTKIPITCQGKAASVNDPSTWETFECAVTNANVGNGIGFVFTKDDPYTGIDLDYTTDAIELERQINIYNTFNSYSERSPSGNGAHIIVRGNIGTGARRSPLEVYSQNRYFTMTGDVIRNSPITDYQDLLVVLRDEIKQAGETIVQSMPTDVEQVRDDAEIICIASCAKNGDKFVRLHQGDWRTDYQHKANKSNTASSEADCAYMDMLYFYTQNCEQLKRIFLASGLCRDKYTGKHGEYYLNSLISVASDQMPPTVDFSSMREQAMAMVQSGGAKAMEITPAPPESDTTQQETSALSERMTPIYDNFKYIPPAGLLGDIAKFFYDQAPQQIPEIAIGGAFGFMAGICGQAYNISDKGLNIYLMVLAGTGVGKESMATGIDRLMSAVTMKVPAATTFQGPGEFASSSAMIKQIATTPCCLSIGGEFGLRLRQLCDPDAKGNEIGIRRAFLDLYSKSGKYGKVKSLVYSDRATNTPTIEQPAFSFLGESTPVRFYDAIEAEMVAEGLIPRFSFIEYKGPVPPFNENHGKIELPDNLIDRASSLAAYALTISHNKIPLDVGYTDDALALLNNFRDYARHSNNNSDYEITKEMFSRAHMKVLKIAALIAVGCDYLEPKITLQYAEYAIGFVLTETNLLIDRFQKGEVGKLKASTIETKRIEEVVRAIALFAFSKFGAYKIVGATEEEHAKGIVRKVGIQTRVSPLKPFSSALPSPAIALQNTINTLCEWGWVDEIELSAGARGKKPIAYKIREQEPFLNAFVKLEAQGKVR